MEELPAGTVTFVFTDIEGSTKLLYSLGEEAYAEALERHQRLIRDVVDSKGGREVGTEGDAFFLVFTSASRALEAAIEVQQRLHSAAAPRVRIGVHTGEGVVRNDDYVGLDVHVAARVVAAGHGGQILLSEGTRLLIHDRVLEGAILRDLGEHRLKDVERPVHIYQVSADGLPGTFPPLRTQDVTMRNLPEQLTSFVGREDEIVGAARTLRETRLLTLTGPGGTGKTRLAIQLAERMQDEFADGVTFVPLAPVTVPDFVPSAIAESLGLVEARGVARAPLQRVIDHLEERAMLIVLDNFEHLLPAATVLTDLLKAAPKVKVVVTTRVVLHLYGEREFPVPPLHLPHPDELTDLESLSKFEAAALFMDRAAAVKPDFRLTSENAAAVAEICVRLDGLPLAIELAAARLRLLSPQAIASRLGDSLGLLTSGARDLPARQRTLRGAIAWSHDLLGDAERHLFARLAVFMGGFSLEEVEQVCAEPGEPAFDALAGVESLVDKNLVMALADERGDVRFTMLQTLREFAVEQLEASGEADEIRRRHAGLFLAVAEEAEPHLTGRDARRWLDRLEPDHDNFRTALDWAVDRREARLALALAGSLWRFWQIRGHVLEGRNRVERALSLPGAREHPRERAKALEAAGGLAYWQLDEQNQRRWYEEAVELTLEIGDPALIANAYFNRSFAYPQRPPEAAADLEKSLELFEEIGDEAGIAKAHWGLGNYYYTSPDLDPVLMHLEKSFEIARKVGDEVTAAWSMFMLGVYADRSGRAAEAAQHFCDSLRRFAYVDDVTGILFNLEGLAAAALQENDVDRGGKLWGAAAALRLESGTELTRHAGLTDPNYRARFDELMAAVPQDELAGAVGQGRVMSREQAIAFALTGCGGNPGPSVE